MVYYKSKISIMEDCIFCKIIKGEIPAAKVWEDKDHIAFLSTAPINPGHTLLIPKKHVSYIFNMEDEDLKKLLVAAKPIAKALEKAFSPVTGKVGVMVAGGEIAHVHVHLIPMDKESDLTFAREKHDVPFSEIEKNAEKIRHFLP